MGGGFVPVGGGFVPEGGGFVPEGGGSVVPEDGGLLLLLLELLSSGFDESPDSDDPPQPDSAVAKMNAELDRASRVRSDLVFILSSEPVL